MEMRYLAHVFSTRDDYYFRSKGKSQNRDVAAIIYNGIVEYAYHDNEIDIRKLDILQTRALLSKLKFDGSATKSTQLKIRLSRGGNCFILFLLISFTQKRRCERIFIFCFGEF